MAEIDAYPAIRRERDAQRLILLNRVKGTVFELQEAGKKVKWAPLHKKLQEYADKTPYFTF